METIEATYQVTTPMFCGGADLKAQAELRLPSFKGVLRFWWRALAWGRFGGDLEKIREAENELFGSAGGGQAKVLMRFKETPEPTLLEPKSVLCEPGSPRRVVGQGARYLGYGLMEAFSSRNKGTKEGELLRSCVSAPYDFTVLLRTRLSENQDLLLRAMRAVGLLGGLGARSRRGYGSISLVSLKVDDKETGSPDSPETLADAIRELIGEAKTNDYPQYTALTSMARVLVLTAQAPGSAMHLLDLVGKEMLRYRSWGRNGRILGNVGSEKNFEDDHDLMKEKAGARRNHPRRIVFGLPHNYGKSSDQQVLPSQSALDRRASPLFVHIHDCAGTAVAVISFLPARFLPADEDGRIKVSVGGTKVPLASDEELWKPIHDFINRLLDPDQRKESFASASEVRP